MCSELNQQIIETFLLSLRNKVENETKMKKTLLIGLLAVGLSSCKKELVELTPYKVSAISTRPTYCEYTLKAPGRENIIMKDFCGKYQIGQVVFEVKK